MMKLQTMFVGLLLVVGAAVATAQTEPTVVPAGTETVVKPHKKAGKKHAHKHKVSAKKHKAGKHKKPSVS
jgi:phosphate-selective porin